MCDNATCQQIAQNTASQVQLTNRLLDALKANLKVSIPSYVDQSFFSDNEKTIKLNAQSVNVQIINSILINVTSQPATLIVGKRKYPINNSGITFWNNICWVLHGTEEIILTQNATGQMSIEMMGIELPDTGIF